MVRSLEAFQTRMKGFTPESRCTASSTSFHTLAVVFGATALGRARKAFLAILSGRGALAVLGSAASVAAAHPACAAALVGGHAHAVLEGAHGPVRAPRRCLAAFGGGVTRPLLRDRASAEFTA